jgi:hypothetical protein
MRKKKLLLMIIGCITLCEMFFGLNSSLAKESSTAEPSLKVSWIYLASQTYTNVTIKSIEDMALFKIWFYGDHPFIKQVREILTHTSNNNSFQSNYVRMKLEYPLERVIYYIDTNGIVEEHPSLKRFTIGKDSAMHIEELLLPYHGVVDLIPQPNYPLIIQNK